MTGPRRSRTTYIVLAALLILVPLLAVLQYRWIGEVSQADRQRLAEHLNLAGNRFVQDFNRELGRVLTLFEVRTPLDSAELPHWFLQQDEEAATSNPSLIKRVFLVNLTESRELAIQQFSSKTGELEKIEWPSELKALRENMEARLQAGRQTPPAPWDPLSTGSPIFQVPARIPNALPSWTLVEFNQQTLFQEFLPSMVSRHFTAADTADYRIALATRGSRPQLIYKSEPSITEEELTTPDLRMPLFILDFGRGRPPGGSPPSQLASNPDRPTQDPGDRARFEDRGFGFPGGRRGDGGRGQFDDPFRRGRGGPPGAPPGGRRDNDPRTQQAPRPQYAGARGPAGPILAGSWEIVVKHRSGSLDTAIESLRRRNIGISFGILLLLACSVVMVVVSSHRARSLAQLQMDFVARVSHELRTPLAIIRSAAYNVANGVVSSEKDVREYASMVQTEGQRLSNMVDQILMFSQTESGHHTYDIRPVQVSSVIERVVGLHQTKYEIDQDIAGNLPWVKADERALTDCLQNLLSNAMKYGGANSPPRVRVEARRADTNTVVISVADSGPGIDVADLPHIFEPFYRGRNARSDTPGSGLGLNLVRRLMNAQGGKVTVESEPGEGARFTLHLTAVQESPS